MLFRNRIARNNPERGAALAVFARSPEAGQCKTRLIPVLGEEGAATFQQALIADTGCKAALLRGQFAAYLMIAGPRRARLPTLLPSSFTLFRQRGSDLGERLENAFGRLLKRHSQVVIIGTDSPLLPPRILSRAAEELRWCDAVLGPCPDGGYYLIGLRRQDGRSRPRGLLRGIRWGSRHALRDTMHALLDAGLSVSLLDPFEDVDRPKDFTRLVKRLSASAASRRQAPATWQWLRNRGAAPRGMRM